MTKAELERANAQLERALKRETAARKRTATSRLREAPAQEAETVAPQYAERERDALRAQLGQSLDQQAATAEILRVIGRVQTDAQPAFDAILHSGVRLLRGAAGVITRIVGDQLELEHRPHKGPVDVTSVPRGSPCRHRTPTLATRPHVAIGLRAEDRSRLLGNDQG